jgi:hypothetical protein
LPIHNGTFGLAMHAWHEPFERITPRPHPSHRAGDTGTTRPSSNCHGT